MKQVCLAAVVLLVLAFFAGCTSTPAANDTKSAPTVSATENWDGSFIFPTGSGSGGLYLKKMSDNSLYSSGIMTAGTILIPFTNNQTTVSGSSISISGGGTATNSAYSVVSAFTISITGTMSGGSGSGTFVIVFSDSAWGPTNSGSWTASRTNGSGVTP